METEERVVHLGRKKAIKVGTLFPQTESGHCSVCKQEITAPRKRRYCSDHCRQVAYATQKFFLWQKVRQQILERDNWTCQACGVSKQDLINEHREKHPDKVEAFGVPDFDSKFHVDHIKPVSKGGQMFDFENLEVKCQDCNLEKSDKYTGEKDIFDFYKMDEGEDVFPESFINEFWDLLETTDIDAYHLEIVDSLLRALQRTDKVPKEAENLVRRGTLKIEDEVDQSSKGDA
ncbi:HNH endonuclease [Halobacteria archaeon AArc-curdl1]|uniref:HNH endonuclease n=1 Tax=Natronosalvus hydrolyticus TaxID=2979988 RepID=A0AAP2ZA08_9EURY|nr:HNH endonuclease [Halobacteria archaeon AArc-curdl1]